SGGARTLIEGGPINNRLERGPGLAMGNDSAIIFAAPEIVPPDHGPDRAGARINGHQCSLDDRRLLEPKLHDAVASHLLDRDLDDVSRFQYLLRTGQHDDVLRQIPSLQPASRPGHVVER